MLLEPGRSKTERLFIIPNKNIVFLKKHLGFTDFPPLPFML